MSVRRGITAVTIILAISPYAHAQDGGPGFTTPRAPLPDAFRTGIGLSVLAPLGAGPVAQGVPSFRLTAVHNLRPSFGIPISAYQLGGDSAILRGVSVGLRWRQQVGAIGLSSGLDLLGAEAIVDMGGWFVEQGDGQVAYRPYRRSGGWAYGARLSTGAQWFHSSGWGVELTLEYWRSRRIAIAELRGARAARGLAIGLGVRQGLRNAPWYWRTSGQDNDAPFVTVLSPEADTAGLYDAASDGVTLLAADRSGIATVLVDGAAVTPLSRAPRAALDHVGVVGPATLATIKVPISMRRRLHVEVVDGAGNRSHLRVPLAMPALPQVVIATPEPDADVHVPYADVSGIVFNAGPMVRLQVNACRATTVGIAPPVGESFSVRVPLQPGINALEVDVVDPLGRTAVARREVLFSPARRSAMPEALPAVTATARPSASGRALRVQGRVSDPAQLGLRDVRVGDAPAALSFRGSSRAEADFLAYVPLDTGMSLGVLAETADGRHAEQELSAPRARSARVTGAALLIGIENYADESLAGPPGAEDAATTLASLLSQRSPAAAISATTRVLMGSAATSRAVREALNWLQTAASEASVVYVYVAGRAVQGRDGQALGLVPHDAPDALGSEAIPWSEILSRLQSLPAEVVFITELVGDGGTAAPPPVEPACGMLPLPAGGMAVVAATHAGDGSFSRRVVELLSGEGGRMGSSVILLRDLLGSLSALGDGEPVLRTRGPVFDAELPLVRIPDER